jgi:hypothetical protein
MNDTVIYFGGAVKALDDNGKVGGQLVRISTKDDQDLTGEHFTAKTYLGKDDGDGVDVLFHHGMPIKKGFEDFASHIFKNAVKTSRNDIGVWAETVLDLADKYESKVFELVKAGKLGWSSGSTARVVRKSADGEILRWPIVEASLTPAPAEPRNRAIAIKSVEDFSSLFNLSGDEAFAETKNLESILESGLRDGLRFEQRLDLVLAANEQVIKDAKEINELRKATKAGRKISTARMTKLKEIMAQLTGFLSEVDTEETPVEKSVDPAVLTSLVADFEYQKMLHNSSK